MSDKLGPIAYNKNDSEPFLGRDIQRPQQYSEATARSIDGEVHDVIMAQYNRAKDILTTNADALERLAKALIEREALGLEEVTAAIAGTPMPPAPSRPAPPPAGSSKPASSSESDDKDKKVAAPLTPPQPAT